MKNKKIFDCLKTWTLGVLITTIVYAIVQSPKTSIEVVYGGTGGNEVFASDSSDPGGGQIAINNLPTSTVLSNAKTTQDFLTLSPKYITGYHMGTDVVIGKGYGEDIPSITNGTVTYAEKRCNSVDSEACGFGLGNLIIVQNDTIMIKYGHGFDVKVNAGDAVTIGQVIERQSSSGTSTGTHLHAECRAYGLYVDCSDYVQNHDNYVSAAVRACETFIGDRKHIKTKELIRDHCRGFYDEAAKLNQDFFQILAIGHAETNWCTNPNAKIPDNNCYGWAVFGNNDDPRMNCGSWENCFGKVVGTFKAYEDDKRFFLNQKLQRYTPSNVAGHAKNINWGVTQLLKEYKKNLRI